MDKEKEILGSATYNPTDDKLRFYPSSRLSEEIFEKFRKYGFLWAPYQKWFGQVWTPEREDLILQYSASIDDEDKSLMERAEERGERFSQYSEHARTQATEFGDRARAISDNIPFGQPILVGHHSERHARADQERIWNNLGKSANAWDRAEYWKYRANRTIQHVEYKELPTVRFRRIKGLKADLRSHQRDQKRYDQTPKGLSNIDWLQWEAKNEQHLTDPVAISEWINRVIQHNAKHQQRWIDHLTNRIAYETALYEGNQINAEKQGIPIEKGGQVLCGSHISSTLMWYEVLKVNKDREGNVNSVTIPSTVSWRRHWIVKVDIIKGVRSKEMIASDTFPEGCTNFLVYSYQVNNPLA